MEKCPAPHLLESAIGISLNREIREWNVSFGKLVTTAVKLIVFPIRRALIT